MKQSDIGDLDFYIGEEATNVRHNYAVDYPIRHGIIDNWDHMEKFWQRCIFQYLRCDPEEHYVLLTEPPMNKFVFEVVDVAFFCKHSFDEGVVGFSVLLAEFTLDGFGVFEGKDFEVFDTVFF